MKYKVFGEENQPIMIFITGAGIGPFMWKYQVAHFKTYKIIVFNLPGHGDNSDEQFTTIQATGGKILNIIKNESKSGKAILIGHSIGAQTVMWIIENHYEHVDKAVIISGLNKPIKGMNWLIKPTISISMPLIKFRSFAKLQSKELNLPDDMFEAYYQDSLLISGKTLTNILISNLNFEFIGISGTLSQNTLVIVGENEKKMMIQSAEKTASLLRNIAYYEFASAGHGIPYEMPQQLNDLIEHFVMNNLVDFHSNDVKVINI